jgi:hypothetical protein
MFVLFVYTEESDTIHTLWKCRIPSSRIIFSLKNKFIVDTTYINLLYLSFNIYGIDYRASKLINSPRYLYFSSQTEVSHRNIDYIILRSNMISLKSF